MPRPAAGTSGLSQDGTPPDSAATIYLVADDAARSAQLTTTVRGMGFPVEAFASLASYLAPAAAGRFGCLLYDGESCLPAMSLLAPTESDWPALPVVFLTDDQDVRLVVKAMRDGAVDFLFRRTCADSDLWEALQNGVNRHGKDRRAAEERRERLSRLAQLSETEREILLRLVDGQNNRQIAEELQLTRSAVEGRRTRLMRKLGIAHLPGLVKFMTSAEE